MKKILIFSLAYYPHHVGGAEVALQEITKRIEDIEFHMVTMRYDSALPALSQVGNIVVHRIGYAQPGTTISQTFSPWWYLQKILFVPGAFFKALSLHHTHHYDGFWAMMSYMLFPIVLLRLTGSKVPYALTLQEGDSFERVFGRLRIILFKPLLSYGFRHASVVQTISTFLAIWARKEGFTGTLEVIPNGVDTSHFSATPNAEALREIKHTLAIQEGKIYLITTSRLVYKNALDDVLRALALLPEDIHFLVLGTGPEEVSLKKLAESLGVAQRVQWLGHIEQSKLPLYLKAAHIFIRPSRSEGMGNSFIEAMAAGVPVVATQEGGIRDFLFDRGLNPDKQATGWAVEKNNPTHIAQTLQYMLAHPDEVAQVTATAKAYISGTYDWNTIAQDMRHKVFLPLLGV